MNRKRFEKYRSSKLKYTFQFMFAGFDKVLLNWRYVLVAFALLVCEFRAFAALNNLVWKQSMGTDLKRIYSILIISALALLFLVVVTEIGRPKGFRRIMRQMEKIPNILNGDLEAPVLVSRRKIGKKTEQWIFDTYGKHYSDFRELRKEIESALDVGIIRITEGRDGHKVVIDLTVHPGPWPHKVPWEDKYIVPDYFILPLGVNRTEVTHLNLAQTAHVIINGSTGSGKTVEMKQLCYCALMKGFQVHLVDYKLGVDYGPEWEQHCNVVTESDAFLTVLERLISEQQQRFLFLREHGCENIDLYNERFPTAPLQRIILFVDELGECLDKSGLSKERKETVDKIMQGLNTLCRLGRAAGISCILSTQRGSADLISGQVRNNAYKIVGRCDENLSLLTIGTTDAAKELVYPGQFMDEFGDVYQGFYADYSDLLRQRREEGKVGSYGLKHPPIHSLREAEIEVLEDDK